MQIESSPSAPARRAPTVEGVERWSGLESLRPTLEGWLAGKCSDRSEMDDVIQETFLRAARYRSSLGCLKGLRAWVMRIAANVYNDLYSRGSSYRATVVDDRVFETVEGREPDPGEAGSDEHIRIGEQVIEKDTLVDELRRAFGRLADHDRHVLDSYYGGSQSCIETAAICRLPAHLVKVRLFRARRKLEQAVRARMKEDEW